MRLGTYGPFDLIDFCRPALFYSLFPETGRLRHVEVNITRGFKCSAQGGSQMMTDIDREID